MELNTQNIMDIVNYVVFSKKDDGKYNFSSYKLQKTPFKGRTMAIDIIMKLRHGKANIDNISLKNVLNLVHIYNESKKESK